MFIINFFEGKQKIIRVCFHTSEEIQTVMKELFGMPALEKTQLWNKYTGNAYQQLARLGLTVNEASIISAGCSLSKGRMKMAIWPSQVSSRKVCPSVNFYIV